MSEASDQSLGNLSPAADGKNPLPDSSPSSVPQQQDNKNVSAEEQEEKLIKATAQELAEKIASDSQLFSTLTSDVAKLLSNEKRLWVGLSLALAIVSLAIMGIVYGLSLQLGGTDAIKTFAVPIISAFCLVVLVINVAFNMVVFRVTR